MKAADCDDRIDAPGVPLQSRLGAAIALSAPLLDLSSRATAGTMFAPKGFHLLPCKALRNLRLNLPEPGDWLYELLPVRLTLS